MTLEKSLYYAKYTAGSYLDVFSSIPIWTAENIARGSEKLLGERNPRFLSREHIHEKSPIYIGREKLRETLDTKPGALYLQSNFIGALPFIVAGVPAAEFAQMGIDKYLQDAPEIVKCALNSLSTLAAQMVAGYTTFMANEVRVNSEKYRENGKLSARKIGRGLTNAVKAFLSFDLSYISGKTLGQSAMIYAGKDAGLASAIFDIAVIPIWYTIAIPLGLKKGIIQTKDNKADDRIDNETKKE
jgi:hypothetical protein